MKRILGSQKSQEFSFCADHALLFTTYYEIAHMDWIVHWNCYNWVCNSLGDQSLSAEKVIDLINPLSFKCLVKFCMSLYLRLDRLSYYGPKNKRMNNLNSDWSMMAKRWKRSLIYQSNEEKNSGNNNEEQNFGNKRKKLKKC
uniref:Uncharacterized protein n=1 Tax=Ditylenchus dipsaci TaxID=166011 RepID=A0A915DFW6_9BILA